MFRLSAIWIVALGLMCSTVAQAEEDIEEISVAVMEFASKGGITQEQVDALSDMLANEIRGRGKYRVVGKSDIRAALQLEEQKILLGCTDESCVAEIGGALGVNWIVVGNVSLFGKTYLLNLKLLDVRTIKVLAGVSRKVSGGEDALLDAMGAAAEEMLAVAKGEKRPKAASVTASETPAPASDKAKTYSTWGHITFWAGAGCTALSMIALGMAKKSADEYNDAYYEHDEQINAFNRNMGWSTATWALLGTGLGLMTTGVVLWLVDPSSEEIDDSSTTAAAIAPTLDGQGLVFSLGGRW